MRDYLVFAVHIEYYPVQKLSLLQRCCVMGTFAAQDITQLGKIVSQRIYSLSKSH